MNVSVIRKRNGGRRVGDWRDPLPRIGGPLVIGYQEEGGGKKLPCMRVHDIHGVENIELYQARVAGVTGSTISLAGLECIQRCWYLQEWEMTITSVDPPPTRQGSR